MWRLFKVKVFFVSLNTELGFLIILIIFDFFTKASRAEIFWIELCFSTLYFQNGWLTEMVNSVDV